MPALTIPNSFSANTLIQSAQVNANFSAITTLLNSTLLANDNIQTGGIATANLAANCVTGAKLASNVVDDSTLQYTSSQLSIKALGVGTSQLAASAVTTAKISALNVTRAKLEAVGQQISSSSGAVESGLTSFVDITNLEATITTTGRPVMVMLQSDGGGSSSYFGITNTTSVSTAGSLKLLRGVTEIARYQFGVSPTSAYSSGTASFYGNMAPFLDTPSAGTYTYKLQYASSNTAQAVTSQFMKLVVWEL